MGSEMCIRDRTLRGPRGGMLLIGNDFENPFGKVARKSGRVRNMSELFDSAVFPGTQGGPLMHVIAAKAVSFLEALDPAFKAYARQVVINARAMADEFLRRGYDVVSGGTDNHMALIDLRSRGITGVVAERALQAAEITVNKNMVPFDDKSPFVTSGIRVGTAAMTTRGFGKSTFREVVRMIDRVLNHVGDESVGREVKGEVLELCRHHPLYDFVTA